MKVIGITGGIGSGKSFVCEILRRDFKAFLINMDQIAHSFMESGGISYELIVKHFGKHILDQDGQIDRKKLGEIVYKDEEELKYLNSFTHPYVLSYVKDLISEKTLQQEVLICVESALPVEGKLEEICDEVWFVQAPYAIRRERLMNNRDYSKEKIDSIFSKQIAEDKYKAISSKVIYNETSKEELIKQIDSLLRE